MFRTLFDTHSDGTSRLNNADWKMFLNRKARSVRLKKNIFAYLLFPVFYLLIQRLRERREVKSHVTTK
jgi:hypothetical protein